MAELNLQRFCATEADTRAFMRAPGRRADYAYATNGYVVVRVLAADMPAAKPLSEDELPRMPAMFDCIDKAQELCWHPLPGVINVTRCSRCRGAARLCVELCDSCDGKGAFDRDGHDYECKACGGEGFHEAAQGDHHVDCPQCCGEGFERNSRQDLDIGGGYPTVRVNAGYLSWLARLPGVVMSPQNPDQLVRFKFEGGHALLMPIKP